MDQHPAKTLCSVFGRVLGCCMVVVVVGATLAQLDQATPAIDYGCMLGCSGVMASAAYMEWVVLGKWEPT